MIGKTMELTNAEFRKGNGVSFLPAVLILVNLGKIVKICLKFKGHEVICSRREGNDERELDWYSHFGRRIDGGRIAPYANLGSGAGTGRVRRSPTGRGEPASRVAEMYRGLRLVALDAG